MKPPRRVRAGRSAIRILEFCGSDFGDLGAVELENGLCDFLDVFFLEARGDGEGDDTFREIFRHGESAFLVPQILETGLKVQGDGVIERRADALFLEVGLEFVAIGNEKGEDVEDVGAVIGEFGFHERRAFEELVVEASIFDAFEVHLIDIGEFEGEEGGLDGVEAAVVPDDVVEISVCAAGASVVAEFADEFGLGVVVGAEEAAVADAAEVFRGIEGVSAEESEGAGAAVVRFCAEGLADVLDDGDAVGAGDGGDAIDLGKLSEEMNGHDGLGAVAEAGEGFVGIEVEGVGFDIDENRSRAEADDDVGAGDKAEGGNDDFVSRAHAEAGEGQEEGIGAGGDADGVFGAEVFSGLFLEFLEGRTQDKLR